MDQLINELNELMIYHCQECHCAVGDDWEYLNFSNKTATKCPQCGNIIHLI